MTKKPGRVEYTDDGVCRGCGATIRGFVAPDGRQGIFHPDPVCKLFLGLAEDGTLVETAEFDRVTGEVLVPTKERLN